MKGTQLYTLHPCPEQLVRLAFWNNGNREKLSNGISQHNSRSPDSFQGASCIPLDLSGKGPACTHLYFWISYFSGVAVAGFSDALGKNAHGTMCWMGRLIPPQTPPLVFCCAREGMLYIGLLVAHPCVTACVTQDPPRDFVLTCTRGI